jgi:hypothetical protein
MKKKIKTAVTTRSPSLCVAYYDTRYRIGIISDSPPTLSVGIKACGLTKGGVKAFAAVVTNNY